jgi:hypothetical protein
MIGLLYELLDFLQRAFTLYVLAVHPICGVIAPFVSRDNHVKTPLACTLGFVLGPLGVWWVMRLNRKAARLIAEQNARIDASVTHEEHPMFKHAGNLPPDDSARPLVPGSEIQAPLAFRVPAPGFGGRKRSQGAMPSVKPDELES